MFALRLIEKIDEGKCISPTLKSYRMLNEHKECYVEIKCQLDATDDIYFRFIYCCCFKAAVCKPDT